IFGYPRETAIGALLGDLIVPEAFRAMHAAGLAHAARTGEGPVLNSRIEVPALRADGAEIAIELCISPLAPSAPGESWSFCAFARDLSARNATETALRETETRLAHLVETLPGMAYEFRLRPDGTMGMSYVSSGCREIFGISPEEYMAEPIETRIPVSERGGFASSIFASARDLSPFEWTGAVTGKDGAEIVIEVASRPERTTDGGTVWHGILNDVTAKRREAAANDRNRLFLRAIVEGIPDIVFIKDADTLSYTLMNHAGEAFFGLRAEDVVGRDDFDLFGPVAAMRMVAEDEDLLARGELFANEATHKDGQGRSISLRTRRIGIEDPVSGKRYILGISSDVSAYKALEEHLRLVNESLEETVLIRTEQLRATQEEVVDRLGRAAAYRDGETGEHIVRMARICGLVAAELGVPPAECDLLRAAAPMHDIGKIGIPDGILHKPGRLESEETAVMRTHAEIGSQMLAGGTSDLLVVAELVARTHHERWDGAGYPHGLAGEEIPLAGRIAAIADVFDALTSERPYKRAWRVEDAVAEIERASGTHFDPAVVAAFARALP
ncbi:PAS domain S-box protein, partial [bacterium]